MTKKAIYIIEYFYCDRVMTDYFRDKADLTTAEMYKKAKKEIEFLNDVKIDINDIENVYSISENIIKEVAETL